MDRTPFTYAQFWPHYLREHAQPATRALHFFGTALGLLLFGLALVTGIWWLLPAAVVAGYLFAWIGHLTVECNRPATFVHPLWSLISDFRMFFLWLTGRLWRELDKAGVRAAGSVNGDSTIPPAGPAPSQRYGGGAGASANGTTAVPPHKPDPARPR